MKTGLVTGSFDPPTRGHLSVIQKAAALFDEVIVCLFVNREKEPLFSIQDRYRMMEAMIKEAGLLTRVRLDTDDGYVADYAERHGIDFLVRGIRSGEDADYEIAMAAFNRSRAPGLETLFFVSTVEEARISSTLARSCLKKGDFSNHTILVPSTIAILHSLGRAGTLPPDLQKIYVAPDRSDFTV